MRSVPEWIGKNDDAAIPARVRLRIFEAAGGKCQFCGLPVIGPCFDHIIALVNGGENREGNIQLLCLSCHSLKTKTDVATKSKGYKVRLRHAGIKRRKGRPLAGTKASGWKKKMDGTVERR